MMTEDYIHDLPDDSSWATHCRREARYTMYRGVADGIYQRGLDPNDPEVRARASRYAEMYGWAPLLPTTA